MKYSLVLFTSNLLIQMLLSFKNLVFKFKKPNPVRRCDLTIISATTWIATLFLMGYLLVQSCLSSLLGRFVFLELKPGSRFRPAFPCGRSSATAIPRQGNVPSCCSTIRWTAALQTIVEKRVRVVYSFRVLVSATLKGAKRASIFERNSENSFVVFLFGIFFYK